MRTRCWLAALILASGCSTEAPNTTGSTGTEARAGAAAAGTSASSPEAAPSRGDRPREAGSAGAGASGDGSPAGTGGGDVREGTPVGGAGATAGSAAAGAAGTPAADGGGAAGAAAPDEPRTDSEGCPLDLVGFATLEGGTTGGGAASPTPITSQAELRECAKAADPRVCSITGTIQFEPFEEIEVKSNKTIIGAGTSGEIVMGGFRLNAGVRNVIIRNLTIRDSFIEGQAEDGGDGGGDRDGVQLDTAQHVWIDHVHFKHLGDGLIDSRKDTTFLTVSWNILENHNKAFGIGWTDNVTAQLTIHHNWIHDTVQRNPSTDNVLRAHLFNNVLENVESYGNYSRGMTNMVLQNSVFSNVKDPHYYDTGTLVATGNVYRNTTGRKAATSDTYSFFDPATYYRYSLDAAAHAEAIVKRCAGPRAELGAN